MISLALCVESFAFLQAFFFFLKSLSFAFCHEAGIFLLSGRILKAANNLGYHWHKSLTLHFR